MNHLLGRWQMIHMKCQDFILSLDISCESSAWQMADDSHEMPRLYSLKKKKKKRKQKVKLFSAAVVIGAFKG